MCTLIPQQETKRRKEREVQEKKCLSVLVTGAVCADVITNSTESSAYEVTWLQGVSVTDCERRWTGRSIAAADWNSDVQYLSHFRKVGECSWTNSLWPQSSSEHSLSRNSPTHNDWLFPAGTGEQNSSGLCKFEADNLTFELFLPLWQRKATIDGSLLPISCLTFWVYTRPILNTRITSVHPMRRLTALK